MVVVEKQEKELESIPQEEVLPNYSKPENGSSILSSLTIYKSDLENYEPYILLNGSTINEKEENTENETSTKKDNIDFSQLETENKDSYDFQLGKILEEYYYNIDTSIDFEQDYIDISSNINIILKYQK